MGLIGGLLLLPITAPVWGFRLFLERIRDEAEAMLHDEGRAFAELIDLSMRRNAGQLSDDEFAEQEAELLERLSSIRESRDELLHGETETEDDEWLDDEPEMEDDELIDDDPEPNDGEPVDVEPEMHVGEEDR